MAVTYRPPLVGAYLLPGATGLFLGIGLGLLVMAGRIWPIVALPLFALGLWALVRSLVLPSDQPRVARIAALAYALHIAVSVGLYTWAVAAGRGGFTPGDDAEYFFLARTFVAYWKGVPDPASVPPYWGGAAYLFGTWVYLESAIFAVIGPEVLVPILLNGVFALATAFLAYDMARRLFDQRAAQIAFAVVAFFPSLFLWSSLNLKDSLVLLLVGVCLRHLIVFHEAPHWRPLAIAFVVLVAMESLREYIFVGLAVLIPILTALTPRVDMARRARWTGSAVLASAVLLALPQAGVSLGPQLPQSLEDVRRAMALGARTAFVEPPPVIVKEGDTFVVPTAPATATPVTSPGATPLPTEPPPSPRIVHVPPNTRLSTVPREPSATEQPGVVTVGPGDIVVVGGLNRTPAPAAQHTLLALNTSTQLSSGGRSESELIITVRHLPVGLAFTLFGPFPWLFARQLDLLILFENALWYLCLGALAATVLHERRRWQVLAPLLLFIAGLIGLLSIVEGNWGTLFRHRGMVIPWVVILAAPSFPISRWLRRHRDRP